MTTLEGLVSISSKMEEVVEPIKQPAKRKRLNPQQRIVSLLETPPIREGTDRYRKMLVVMSCFTVGSALRELKNLTNPIGGGVDIRLAEKVGAIRLDSLLEG